MTVRCFSIYFRFKYTELDLGKGGTLMGFFSLQVLWQYVMKSAGY